MKTTFIAIFLYIVGFSASAAAGDSIPPLATKEDCKHAEPMIKKCANYLLSNPLNEKDKTCEMAGALIFMWMTNSEYHFAVDADMSKYCNKDKGLMRVLFASMADVVLENPAVNADPKKMKLASFGRFIDYCASADNKVKKTPELKKLITAYADGKLETVLDMSTGTDQ
ncbi:MAG: hypothetical protein JST83_13230 [Bacteroidetes bacterium]|nr:hypothetical protein [Bacteroidota bacterium]